MTILRVLEKKIFFFFFFSVRGFPAFLTTDRLWGFALRPLRIPHQGDRILTYGSLNLLAFLTKDRLWGFALRPLRIPRQSDRIRTYGSLKLLHRLFGRLFLKRIVTTDDLFDDSGQHAYLCWVICHKTHSL